MASPTPRSRCPTSATPTPRSCGSRCPTSSATSPRPSTIIPTCRAGRSRGVTFTLLAGALAGRQAPCRLYSPLLGADLACHDASTLQLTLDPHFEYGLLPLEGGLEVGGEHFAVNELAYLGDGRDGLQLQLDPGARVLLLGGAPFGAEIFMWWNFVGHSKGEIARAQKAWEEGDARFGRLDALEGPRLSAPPIPWKIDAE